MSEFKEYYSLTHMYRKRAIRLVTLDEKANQRGIQITISVRQININISN